MASFYNRTRFYEQLNRPSIFLGVIDITIVVLLLLFFCLLFISQFFQLNLLWNGIFLLFYLGVHFSFVLISKHYDYYFLAKFLVFLQVRQGSLSSSIIVSEDYNMKGANAIDIEKMMENSSNFLWFFRNWLYWTKYHFIARGSNEAFSIPVSHFENNIIYNQDGSLSILLKVEGLDFCSLTPNDSARRFNDVFNLLNNQCFEHVVFSVYSYRSAVPIDKNNSLLYPESRFGKIVNKLWVNSFKQDWVNHHYIMLTTVSSYLTKIVVKDPLSFLKNTVDIVKNFLGHYNVSVCSKGEFSEFLTKLIFFRPVTGMLEENNYVNKDCGDSIHFFYDYIEALEQVAGKYVGYIVLKNFHSNLDDRFIHQLMVIDSNILINLHCSKIPDDNIKSIVKKKLARYQEVAHTMAIKQEFSNVLENLNKGSLKMYNMSAIIQVEASTLKELKDTQNRVQTLIRNNQHDANIITKNTATIHNALYPTKRLLNKQNIVVSSENIANLCTFTVMQSGYKSNPWCSDLSEEKRSPVQYFATTYGNQFSFNFHIGEKKGDIGHTLIVGDSGTGKTVLANFLMSATLKYPDMKVRAFDSLKGQYIFTKVSKGKYQSFDGSCKMNPCDLDVVDNPENMLLAENFLIDFLSTVAGSLTEEEKNTISEEVQQFMKLTISKDVSDNESTILDLIQRFTDTNNQSKKSLMEKFKRYISLSPENNIFVPDPFSDQVSFSSQLCTFDFSNLINGGEKKETMLALISSYLIYKMYIDQSPMLVFIDELPAYHKSKIFSNMVVKLLNEGRKLDKVVLAAIQKIGQIDKQMFTSFKNFLLFPMPTMTKEEQDFLMTDLSLSIRDIEWLKNTSMQSRQVLNVRFGVNVGCTTVRLDTRLDNVLGPFIQGFSSNAKQVELLRNIEHQHKKNSPEFDDSVLEQYFKIPIEQVNRIENL